MLDRIDRKILGILQQDGRVTNQDLADKVGLSATPCLRRLRRLKAEGYICGYTAIVDQKLYGLPISVFVSVKLVQQADEYIDEFENAVMAWPEVMECYLVTGGRDYLMRVVTDGLESYERFIKKKITRLKGVGQVESCFSMNTIKREQQLPPIVG
ncbi:Lrp/AsnC family transcriptional regulator [Pacificimonas sp. WHA3]|uniref:Lrp/AsnC family transcriptional regulator n=1 Tax=Pacificimonas pallii TaxID=2827236 RepID=A0ABS6SHH6_9SPHN|nr:Lrp/AsnC family transcriptional regulator [Pacificimonas pallii]MBV7257366.1 Lrp/AsnC family transcriptional regulator [Pacificimonas pallii]